MQILAEKIKADKKLVVADNMGLTESEAKAFWPIYDAHQKDLAQLASNPAAGLWSTSPYHWLIFPALPLL